MPPIPYDFPFSFSYNSLLPSFPSCSQVQSALPPRVNSIMKNADIELHHIPTMPSSLHRSQSFTRSTTSRSSPFPLPPPRRIHSAPLKRSPSRTSSRSSSSASTSSSEHAEKAQYHIPKHRHTNVYTECGRHSDDWLFGGLGLGDVVGWIRGRMPNVQHGK